MDRLKEAARGRWLQSDYEVVPTDGPELGAAGSGDDAEVEMLKQRNNGSSSSPDGGFGYPTKHELATLRRVSGKIPWAACTIAFVELCERFSYYGTTSVFVNFIQQPLPDGSVTGAGKSGQSGALNMGQRTSTAITTFGTFLAYIMPLFGAYVAEQFLGRFKTMQYAIRIELLGHIFIILAATSPIIVHPILSISFLTTGIIILSVGVGGFKSNISPLIAEQCSETVMQIKITSKGERVIMDPSVTISRVYLYFYLMGNVGALTGSLSMAYAEKYVGFWLSYLLSTLVLCACPIVMMTFHGSYRLTAPTGSSVGKAARLWKMALMNQWSWNPFQFRKNIKKPGFWASVKPSRVFPKPGWMTFDDAWVDEVRRGFLACKVFLWYPLFYLAFGQMMNNLTSQAATMTLDGIPNDITQNLNPLIIIFLIPLMDQIFYPFLRSINIHFTPIRRITCGFFLASLAMFSSTITQIYIYKLSPCGSQANTCKEVSPISVWVQVLPYGLIGFAEIMAAITALEYAFTKAPENMRSTVQAIFLLSNAVSSVLAQAFVVLSEDPYLVWNYGIVGSLAFVGGCAFWLHNRKTDREEDELNMLSSSHAAGIRRSEDLPVTGGGGYAVVRSSADIEMEIIR